MWKQCGAGIEVVPYERGFEALEELGDLCQLRIHVTVFVSFEKIGKAIKFNHFMGLLLGWTYRPIFDQGFCNLVMGGSGYSNPIFYYLMENSIIHWAFYWAEYRPIFYCLFNARILQKLWRKEVPIRSIMSSWKFFFDWEAWLTGNVCFPLACVSSMAFFTHSSIVVLVFKSFYANIR